MFFFPEFNAHPLHKHWLCATEHLCICFTLLFYLCGCVPLDALLVSIKPCPAQTALPLPLHFHGGGGRRCLLCQNSERNLTHAWVFRGSLMGPMRPWLDIMLPYPTPNLVTGTGQHKTGWKLACQSHIPLCALACAYEDTLCLSRICSPSLPMSPGRLIF